MGYRRNISPDPYWGEFDPPWPSPDQELLRRARMPFSSLPGLQERPIPWTEEPDIYRPRQATRRRSPERNTETSRYRPVRSQPLEYDFDRYGPSGYTERRRPSPSPAPTSRAYRSQGSRAATNDDIRSHHNYYRGNREMDRDMEREIERERERERERGRREASWERRRREEEYERGRRDQSSDHGGGRRRSRASRLLDGLERLLKWQTRELGAKDGVKEGASSIAGSRGVAVAEALES